MAITYATWNPADKASQITLTNSNLTADNTVDGTWKSVRANQGKSTGKHLFAFTAQATVTNALIVGLCTAAMDINNYAGATAKSAGIHLAMASWLSNGMTVAGASSTGTLGEVLVAIDCDNGKAYVCQNDAWKGTANPATGANPNITFTAGDTVYPVFSGTNGGTSVTANFGASAFTQTTKIADLVALGYRPSWSTGEPDPLGAALKSYTRRRRT